MIAFGQKQPAYLLWRDEHKRELNEPVEKVGADAGECQVRRVAAGHWHPVASLVASSDPERDEENATAGLACLKLGLKFKLSSSRCAMT